MLIELCVGDYATLDGLVNGANDTSQYYIKTCSKTLIWIIFLQSPNWK
jgi:hypothetical protein